MKIVIPMAGMGYRFQEAGFQDPKPLILIDGKPMIEHVVKMFSPKDEFVFICNSEHLAKSRMKEILKKIAPFGKIVSISPHKLGPVHSVLQALPFIGDEEPVIISHCDFSCGWNYENFKTKMAETKCAGSITAYKGFHPHTLGSTYYAYLREKNNCLIEIKEKASFTNNRMEEFASAGSYYFAKGSYVKRFFQKLVDKKIDCNSEYYVSLVYNLMVKQKLPILIYELKHFLQWGTPEDVYEYQGWSDYFHTEINWRSKKPFKGQTLVPMAGEGKRFQDEGYQVPKPLIPIGKMPMIVQKLKTSPQMDQYMFVYQEKIAKHSNLKTALTQTVKSDVKEIVLKKPTSGQLSTCLEARSSLDPEIPLLIESCDNGLVWDEAEYEKLTNDTSIDAIVWVFKNHPNSNRNPKMFGWIEANGKYVKRASVKIPLSENPKNDLGIIGTFWFRKAKYFFEAADQLIQQNERVNNEFYVDSCVNVLVAQKRNVAPFLVSRYISWGTPNDLKTWQYWNDYFMSSK